MAKQQDDMTTLMLSKSDRERLTALALQRGYRWGERGNATRLIEAIAHGELPLAAQWTTDRIEALLQAHKALVDTGQQAHARELGRLLQERPELGPLDRAGLEAAPGLHTPDVVARVRQFIEQKQPFQLSYQDAQENLFSFKILYADIAFRERRQYLECWVEDAQGGLDVPELQSNRTLRLDRIPDAAIVALPDGQWREEGLDRLVVELHLFNRLAHSYEPRMGDKRDEWANIEGQAIRKVWREVTNTFWLYREVLAQGADCLVVSPAGVSRRIAEQVDKLHSRYMRLLNDGTNAKATLDHAGIMILLWQITHGLEFSDAMITTPQHPYFSPDEYLQIEERSSIKHEYISGYIYAMVGVSGAHNVIAGNLITRLRSHLRGSGCRVYFSDVKVRIETRNRFYYPDLFVTCDSRDRDSEAPYYKRYPVLIVEILSDSTEAFDRGDKFEDYQALESLQEYVLIGSKRQVVQCFRRNDEGLWVLKTYSRPDEPFELSSVGFSGTLEELYEDVSL